MVGLRCHPGPSGNGNGTVAFIVAAEPGRCPHRHPQHRRPHLHGDAGGRVGLSSTPCTYTISPPAASIAAAGGTGTVAVSAGTGCTWTANSNAAWVTVTSGASGIRQRRGRVQRRAECGRRPHRHHQHRRPSLHGDASGRTAPSRLRALTRSLPRMPPSACWEGPAPSP